MSLELDVRNSDWFLSCWSVDTGRHCGSFWARPSAGETKARFSHRGMLQHTVCCLLQVMVGRALRNTGPASLSINTRSSANVLTCIMPHDAMSVFCILLTNSSETRFQQMNHLNRYMCLIDALWILKRLERFILIINNITLSLYWGRIQKAIFINLNTIGAFFLYTYLSHMSAILEIWMCICEDCPTFGPLGHSI